MGTHAPNGDAKPSSSVGLQSNPESFLSVCRCFAQHLWFLSINHFSPACWCESSSVGLQSNPESFL